MITIDTEGLMRLTRYVSEHTFGDRDELICHKIARIKKLREFCSLGLKEAKDLVEAVSEPPVVDPLLVVAASIIEARTPWSPPEPVADACYADCVSPNVPEGFDTVLGYLAKHHPDVLDNFDYDEPQETQRDGFWLRHRCIKLGLDTHYVNAPPVLQRRGITTVRAWPLWLLQERWG